MTLVNILQQANADANFERKAVERRAEMAAQCECLAAWVEGRECVCGDKAIELPLSADNLKKAHALLGEIEGCEKRLAVVSALKSNNPVCSVELEESGMRCINHGQGMVYYEDAYGAVHSRPRVTLPKAVLLAALREERTRLMIELHKTGIVSVSKDNIRVIPK